MNDWLEEWGVGVQNLMVLDSERAIGNPLGVVADILDTTVCENLEVSDTTYVLMPNSVSLELLWENSNHHSATPVLASSASSYAKSFEDFNDVKSYAYADGDEKGPFHLGILCTYSSSVSGVATGGRMLVLGSNYMIADTYLDMEQLANKDYLLEVIDYLYDGVDPLIIDTVKYTSTSMTMLSSQARTILIVLMVIPFVVLAFGIYVWLRRRHK